CFVLLIKPDRDLYRLALDCAQVQPEQAVYLDDRAMFVEVACRMGFHCIHHVSYEITRESLAALGLSLKDEEETSARITI
ncbi:MAG: HAD family phosphatase, partial [Desulfobacca sp.]